MKSGIANLIGVQEVSGVSFYASLLTTLHEASRRAAAHQRLILASLTIPFERSDPLHAFTAAGMADMGERFFWQRPEEGSALVGIGVATTIETSGDTRFADAASAWRNLLNDAVINDVSPIGAVASTGPILFGGYSFDVLASRTALWENFPDGLLILPRFLLSYSPTGAALTINYMIHASDDSGQCADEIEAAVARLYDALARTPALQHETSSAHLTVRELRPALEWQTMVTQAVKMIQDGAFEKVVLARAIEARLDEAAEIFDSSTILQRLRESYPSACVFAVERGEQCFIGATPERLVQVGDGRIQTMALAGSAPRGATPLEDARIGAELLESAKNQSEHAFVVAMMREALSHHCTHVEVSGEPQLLTLKNVQHLKTPIVGELLPGRCILDIIADLHPTPAVGGFPRQAALEAIRSIEELDRSWYAAPLGWIGANGQGEFAVALRCGLIDGGRARLFAGCGIVADSVPQTEYAESCLKFQAMLHALGSVGVRLSAPAAQPHVPRNALYACMGAFIDELHRSGARNVVICPGSRSTPLAMVFAAQRGIRTWMHVDERSAAFFALGMAKRLHQPVALLCTSGTAAANFLPAIVEAKLTHVPLLVLTADRPHELRDNGAPQSIDQNRLYGTYVKWFVDLPLPEATNEALRYMRTIAARSVAHAQTIPAAPVHLNFPLREPLTPASVDDGLLQEELRDAVAWGGRDHDIPYVDVHHPAPVAPTASTVASLLKLISTKRRGLIIVGPHDSAALTEPLVQLARLCGYPILADPLSQLRCGDHDHSMILSSYDAFLRNVAFIEQAQPELVLRFGAMPTSKPLLLYLKRYSSCPVVVIDGHNGWEEPTQLASDIIYADPVALCEHLLAASAQCGEQPSPSTAWANLWQHADSVARHTMEASIQTFEPFFEGRVFRELATLLPPDTMLYVGNSMPVRDLDTFFWNIPQRIHILGNRGANGIDGVISSALGASAAGQNKPALLVIGDLSFFHDLNGLLAARLHKLNLTIVLINNDGGGIFSLLPQAAYPEHFEQLFGTPTGLDYRPAVQMYGGHYQKVESWQQFRQQMSLGLESGGLHVIEVRTERASNVTMHRRLWEDIGRALSEQEQGN